MDEAIEFEQRNRRGRVGKAYFVGKHDKWLNCLQALAILFNLFLKKLSGFLVNVSGKGLNQKRQKC